MSLITINNKPVIIESVSYRGTDYVGDSLEALLKTLSSHLNNISDDIDLSDHTFTVYSDHVESNNKSVTNHPLDYKEIVEKTKKFAYYSPKSPLASVGPKQTLDPQQLKPIAIDDGLKTEIAELRAQIESQKNDAQSILKKIDDLKEKPVNAKDTQISGLKEQLSGLQGLLAEKNEEINKLRESLGQAEKSRQPQGQYYKHLMDLAKGNGELIERLEDALRENNQNTLNQREQIQSLEGKLVEKNEEFSNQLLELSNLKSSSLQLKHELQTLQLKSKYAQDAKDKLSSENKELTSQLERARKENQSVQQELSEANTANPKAIEELQEQLKKSNKDIKHSETLLAAQRTKIDQLNTSLKTTEDRAKKLEEELKSVRTERDNLTTANSRLQAQLKQTQDKIKSPETLFADKQAELRTINSTSSFLKQDLKTLQSERQKVKDKETKLKIEKADLTKVNNELKTEIEQSKTENEKIHKDLIHAKVNSADPKVIQDLNEKLKKSDDTIELWKSSLKAQEATIAQLNTQLSTFKHEVEKLNAEAEVKTREHEQVLRNLRLREQELATLRAQSAEMKAEISSIIAALKAEIERLKVKPKDEEVIEPIVKPVETPVKSTNSIAQKIQNINNKNSLKLSASENARLKTNMLFLEHPIKKITDSTVTLDNKTEINKFSEISSEQKIASEIISIHKKHKKNVANLRSLTNIDGFVGGLLNKKGGSAKDLLVQNGNIVSKLMAYEFLSRNKESKESKEYNESLNEIRSALIALKNRTVIEVTS